MPCVSALSNIMLIRKLKPWLDEKLCLCKITSELIKRFVFLSLSRPYQQSGYIPLEAGKYYWIEALHKEGARRDSLSVGYTLECPNAPPVLSEKPILKPSLQYKIPSK